METSPRVERLIRRLRGGVSLEAMWPHMETLARWEKHAGSPGERRAFDYIARVMKGHGWKVEPLKARCYLSLPVRARLRALGRSPFDVECITHPYATSTPRGGLEGRLTYLPPRAVGEKGAPDDLRGRVVLVEGLATGHVVRALEARGAAGIVFINDDELHNMALSPVWGTPTPESAPRLPRVPVVSVRWEDGQRLRRLGGGARVRVDAQVWSGFKELPLLRCRLAPGGRVADPEGFVLFSGHVDTWHVGAGDNGSANVAMMEVARLLARHRRQLRRGAEMNFWSGHSQGRYAVSTWYADHHWERMSRACVAHVNFDTTGGGEMTVYDDYPVVKEMEDLAGAAIAAETGRKPKSSRLSRSGDHSFMGVGIPAAFSVIAKVPPQAETRIALGGRGGGNPWWWHTVHDTLDKIDADLLERNTRIYAFVAGALCGEVVLPLNYGAAAREILAVLGRYQEAAGRRFDLAPALAAGRRLAALAARLERHRRSLVREDARGAAARAASARVNRCLMRLGRLLIPVGYSEVKPFDQDAAQPAPPMPLLRGVSRLAGLDPRDDACGFLLTRLTRSRNEVVHNLLEACGAIEEALASR